MRTPFFPAGGKAFFWPATCIAVTMLGYSLSAAPAEQAPESKGTWRKVSVLNELSRDHPSRRDTGEYARMIDKLNAITAVLRKSPFLARPTGFDIMPHPVLKSTTPYDSYLQGYAFSDKLRQRMRRFLPYSSLVEHFFYLHRRSCPTCPAKGSPRWTGGLRVHVNGLFDIYGPGTRAFLKDRGTGFFIAPSPAKPVGGFTAYEKGAVVVVTRGKRPILKPVSNREYLQARIRAKEKEMAEVRMKMKRGGNRRRGGRTPAQMREQMDKMEKLYLQMGKPELAAKMKALMELQIKRIEEQEKGPNSPQALLAAGAEKYMEGATEYVKAMRKRLAGMSSQERKQQAYISGKREYMPSMLASKGVEYARPLVKFNRRFFPRDKDKTKSYVFVLVFHGFRDKKPALTPEKRRQLQSQIDWKGLYKLLE